MYDPSKHNFYEKLMKLIAEGKVSPGQINEVDICHDDWCRIYRGGYCNCNPEIRLRPPPEQN